jgi:hypothetical protein
MRDKRGFVIKNYNMANKLYFAVIRKHYKKTTQPLYDDCVSYPEPTYTSRTFSHYSAEIYAKTLLFEEESSAWNRQYEETKQILKNLKTPLPVHCTIEPDNFTFYEFLNKEEYKLVDSFSFDADEVEHNNGEVLWMNIRKGMSVNKYYGMGTEVRFQIPIVENRKGMSARGYKAYPLNNTQDPLIQQSAENVFSMINKGDVCD